jgi:hypothetical protein
MVQKIPVKRLQQRVSSVLCMGLHFCAERLCLVTNRMFGPLKRHLGGSKVDDSEEVKTAFGEWMQMLDPDFFWVRICKFIPSQEKCIDMQ